MSEYIAIKTKHGQSVIELFRDKAPNHVQRIIDLANEGFYNGIKFHRVIDGFMVQGGCPKGNGTSGSDKPNLRAEFNDIKHVEGVMSMARSNDPNSANSQFFIMLGSAPHLDGQYTAFGKVISGMEYIHLIRKGASNNNGTVNNPDSIDEMYVCDVDGNPVTQSDL
jgi:peptidylprolyl isomerase